MKYDIYVDGTYTDFNPDATYGGIVAVKHCNDGHSVDFIWRVYTKDKNFIKSRNVGGELLAAMSAVVRMAVYAKMNPNVEFDVTIYHDYIGIASFIDGDWKAEKVVSQRYRDVVLHCINKHKNLKLRFHKVKAHSGVYYNEIADKVVRGEITEYDHLALQTKEFMS